MHTMAETDTMKTQSQPQESPKTESEQESLLGQTSRGTSYSNMDPIEDPSKPSKHRTCPGGSDEESLQDEDHERDGGWGWVVVAASFFCIAVLDGTCYTAGLFITPLMTSLGSDRGAVTLAGSLLTGVYCMCGLGCARLVMRFGARTICISGALIAYIGLTLASYADHLPELFLGYSVITGIGFGMLYIPSVVAATPYFSKRLSLATSICLCGSGFGTFALAPLSQFLLENYGWWWTFRAQSGLALLCALCGMAMVPADKEREIERKRDEEHLKVLAERRRSSIHTLENGHESMHKVEKRLQFFMRGRYLHTIDEYCTCTDDGNKEHKLEAHDPATLENNDDSNELEELNEEDNIMNSKLDKSRLRTLTTSTEDSDDRPEVDRIAEMLEEINDVSLQNQSPSSNKYLVFLLGPDLVGSSYFSTFVLAVFADCLAFFSVYATYAHLPNFAVSVGTAEDSAAFLLSICGIGNSVGRIMGGWFSDLSWVHPRNLKFGSIVISIIPLFFFIWCHSYPSFLLFSLMFGVSSGFLTSVTVAQMIRLLGLPMLTLAFGLISVFRGVAAMAGPPLAAVLIERVGDPAVSMLLAGLVMVAAAVINFGANLLNKKIERRSQYVSFD